VPLDRKRKEKIAISCNIGMDKVISAPDILNIYEVPINFEKDDIGGKLLEELKLHGRNGRADLARWKNFVTRSNNLKKEVQVAIVGKYFDTGDFVLSDAYISVIEAIKFSAWKVGVKPSVHWLNSKDFESGKKKVALLKRYNGIIIPGGFGETGIEGKLHVIRFVRENKIPYLGLCYGMQLSVIEFARNILKIKDAHTTEIDPNTKHPIVLVMPEQKRNIEEKKYGGTMRLGIYPAYLKKGTIARSAYGKEIVEERHRHRYEINPDYVERLTKAGMVFSGVSPDKVLMEIAELPIKKHPFFLGTQFHPELQARPLNPHPLFTEFIKAAVKRRR
jgi:CTP synthase